MLTLGTEGDGIVSLPDTWEDMVPHEPFMVKQVPSSSQEYSDVKATFDASMKRSNVSYKSIVEVNEESLRITLQVTLFFSQRMGES